MVKNILVLCYSDLAADGRVLRQIRELVKAGYRVSAAAHAPSGLENGSFTPMYHEPQGHLRLPVIPRKAVSFLIRARNSALRALGRHDTAYWAPFRRASLQRLRKGAADLIIANDIDTLPLALALKRPGVKVLFDAHEYSPLQGEGDKTWMRSYHARNTYLCQRHMPLADHSFTVSPSIADLYMELTGVQPQLLTNAPMYRTDGPVTSTQGPIRLVHHGIATPQRRTHELIQMMDGLGNNYHLHLYLIFDRDPAYGQRIQALCKTRDNVSLAPPISPDQICEQIHQYDIGIHRLPPHSTNHRLALPNKFFEFIQARLAIVTSPSPSMAAIIDQEGLGAVAENHGIEALAEAIRSLDLPQINACKQHADQAASRYSAQGNMELLRTTVERLIGKPDAA